MLITHPIEAGLLQTNRWNELGPLDLDKLIEEEKVILDHKL